MRIEGTLIVSSFTDEDTPVPEEFKALDFRVTCPDHPTAGDRATVEIAEHGRLDTTRRPPTEFAPEELRRAFGRWGLPGRTLPDD